MKKQTKTSTFDKFLKKIVQDFDGIEIFDEENESRLNKAVKSLADSFSQEKKWMQVACIESIPQKLYSAIEFPPKAQQKMIDNSLKELASLGLTSQVVDDVITGFVNILKLKGSTKKEPEIEKIFGEADIAGDTYKTCKISKQIWMAENLRDKSNGIIIPGNKYGRLYTYADAQGYYDCNTSNRKMAATKKIHKLKLAGSVDKWRLPTIEDWLKLVSYIKSLGFDAGTALKSNGDWSGDADPGLDLFGFAAHPLKKWDDNLPKKEKIIQAPSNQGKTYKNFYKELYKEDNARIKAGNENIELSIVPHFPCVQFWTNTNYVDDPYIDGDMAYVATIDSAKNTIDLDNGKISGPSGLDSDLPFGFACVRFVKDCN